MEPALKSQRRKEGRPMPDLELMRLQADALARAIDQAERVGSQHVADSMKAQLFDLDADIIEAELEDRRRQPIFTYTTDHDFRNEPRIKE